MGYTYVGRDGKVHYKTTTKASQNKARDKIERDGGQILAEGTFKETQEIVRREKRDYTAQQFSEETGIMAEKEEAGPGGSSSFQDAYTKAIADRLLKKNGEITMAWGANPLGMAAAMAGTAISGAMTMTESSVFVEQEEEQNKVMGLDVFGNIKPVEMTPAQGLLRYAPLALIGYMILKG